MKKVIITREILNLYDKYEGDLGLLDESWAKEKDRMTIAPQQAQVLGDYVDQLHFLKVENLSDDLRNQALRKIKEYEELIDDEVIEILRKRI